MVRQSSGPAHSSVFRGIGIDTTNLVSLMMKIVTTMRMEGNLNVLQAVMICFEATLAMLPATPATLSLLLMLTTQKSVKWMTRTMIIVIIRTAQLVKA